MSNFGDRFVYRFKVVTDSELGVFIAEGERDNNPKKLLKNFTEILSIKRPGAVTDIAVYKCCEYYILNIVSDSVLLIPIDKQFQKDISVMTDEIFWDNVNNRNLKLFYIRDLTQHKIHRR